MISKYKNFLIDKLLESVMVTSADFISIIGSMPGTIIGNRLYGMISNKLDVKTNYNLIGLSDKNDEISFLPDSQYQRFKEKGEDPWTKTKSKSKIGRMIRQLLVDNEYDVTDAQIEDFVNQFKAEWDKRNSINRKVEIVSGDKILYWYDQENYLGNNGTLGNSCMRFSNKNSYMKIYADNPDKISMVIITENDKLIARALLWKLDESTQNKKIYLDRVYYKNDSDFKYLHDWVFENVAKGDEKIFGSHWKSSGGEMICKLENVKFDKYPYADSFHYLYKRLVDGKLTGDGMVSNSNKDGEYVDYVSSEILETDGRENLKTHRYSNMLDVYIKRNDAVYIESIDSYIYKKDAKFSKYTDAWYLEKEVTYSKLLDMWIPNRFTMDHQKYGIIPRDYLVRVVTEYTGTKTTVMGIYNDISDDYESCTKLEDMLKNSDEYFRSSNSPAYRMRDFDIKLKVDDIWGYTYPNFICFKVYQIKDEDAFAEMENSFKIPFARRNGIKITKETADFFSIPIEKTVQYVYPTDYIGGLDNDFYFDYLKIKDEIKASEEITSKYDEFMLEIHDFRYKTDGSYRENANIYKIEREIKRDKYELLKEIVDKSVDEVIKNIDPIRLKRSMSDSGSARLNEDELSFMIKLIPIAYVYYQFTDSWTSSYHEMRRLLNAKGHTISDAVVDTCATLTIYELESRIRSAFNNNLEEFISESKLQVNASDLRSYIFKNYNQQKLYDTFSNLDLK